MWAIRILSGPQAGQIHSLKEGKTRLGRGPSADIQISAAGVSKEHLEITVLADRLLFTDLNSANGTFLNGVRIKGGMLKLGDKLSLHNVIADIVVASDKSLQLGQQPKPQLPKLQPSAQPSGVPMPQAQHLPSYSAAGSGQMPVPQMQQMPQSGYNPVVEPPRPPAPQLSIGEKFNQQINTKLIPPFLQLTEQFEFRYVLMGFVFCYVIIVTLLAMVPMKQITSESIAIEGRRRAITVARSLARGNEKVIRSGDLSAFSTEYAWKEEGIDDVYVVSKEGRILAPAERVGSPPKEANFFKGTILKSGIHESSGEVAGKILAAVPILGYDSDLQQNVAKAYAVVVYNPGSMAFDDGRVFSLFIQMLGLALLAGAMLFFIMYRLIEYPYQTLNNELDSALREGREFAQVRVRLPVLQNMLTNINSLLSRALHPENGKSSGETGRGSKNYEYLNVLQMIGYPALLITKEGQILKGNANFEALTGVPLVNLENQKISAIPDQAMQKNIEELMHNASVMSAQTAIDRLEIGGQMFALSCQALTTATGEVDCYYLTISPLAPAGESAA